LYNPAMAVKIRGLGFYPFWLGPDNRSAKTFQKRLTSSYLMLCTMSEYRTIYSSKNQCSHFYWPACFNICFCSSPL